MSASQSLYADRAGPDLHRRRARDMFTMDSLHFLTGAGYKAASLLFLDIQRQLRDTI